MAHEEEDSPDTAETDAVGAETDSGSDDREEQSEDAEVAGMYESEDPFSDGASDGGSDDDDTAERNAAFDAPLLNQEDEEPETSVGTFYVKYAQESAATLHEVNTAQICTLVDNPGFETHDIIEATLVAQPPMQVSYVIQELESHRKIPIEVSPEPPTKQVSDIAADIETGEAVAIEREGDGEIHILSVEPEDTERTADELHDDEMTYKNAARYGVDRVELRTDESEGVVSIRYLP